MSSTRTLAILGVVLLLVGGVLGYAVRAATSAPKSQLSSAAFRDSMIIDSSLESMGAADQTEQGVVRAATTFISGYLVLAEKSEAEIKQAIEDATVMDVDAQLRTNLLTTIGETRDRIFGRGGPSAQATARLVVAPATYRVEMAVPAKGQQSDEATIRIWFMTVFVQANGSQVQSNWSTATLRMVWRDQWKVASFRADPGPSPLLYTSSGKPSTYNEMLDVLNGFTAYRYATARP